MALTTASLMAGASGVFGAAWLAGEPLQLLPEPASIVTA
jgi:hypothetical protein